MNKKAVAMLSGGRYVREQGLGGIMIWSLDYDVTGEKSLLSAIHQTLHREAQPTATGQ